MLIIKNMLKKHDINKYMFVRYLVENNQIDSLVVEIDPLNAYDLMNKKLITNLGYVYKKPLTDFIVIKEDKISSIKAKKLAKSYHKKFYFYCEECDDVKYANSKTRLKSKVYHDQTKCETNM